MNEEKVMIKSNQLSDNFERSIAINLLIIDLNNELLEIDKNDLILMNEIDILNIEEEELSNEYRN